MAMDWDWSGWVLKIAGMGAGLTLAFLAALVYFQEKLIYIPRLPGMPAGYAFYPGEFGLEHEDVWLVSADGVRLHAWFMWLKDLPIEERRQRPTIVFFQENAGNMSYRLHFLGPLADILGVNVFVLGYRGYGESGGSPSERGFQMDAELALRHVSARADVDPAKIIVFGRSIGGAVALHAAASTSVKVAALVVENTFTSLEDIVPLKIGILRPFIGKDRPCNWLLWNKWDNASAVKRLTETPILFLSSLKDEMLPASQMKELYNVHPTLPWQLATFPDATHMDAFLVDQDRYWSVLFKFLYADIFPGLTPLQRVPQPAPPLRKEGSSGSGTSSHDWETVVPPQAELEAAGAAAATAEEKTEL